MAIKVDYFEREEIGRVRTHQEDSHGHALGTPNGDVFVMCDGMGGHVGGKKASTIGVSSILDYFQREEYPDLRQSLVDAIQFANMQILGYADEHPEFAGMGTTACVLLIKGAEVSIAHVGDSRIYLYLGKERQLHRITKDHSYVQTLVDAGRITDEQAEQHPQKNRILKALGVDVQVVPTVNVSPIKPKKGDVFLLCSDGLSGMIQDAVVESVLSQETDLPQKGNQLVEIALNNGGVDNITAQLVQVTSSPYKKSSFKSFNPQGRPQAQDMTRAPKNLGQVVRIASMAICAVLLIGVLLWKKPEVWEAIKDKFGKEESSRKKEEEGGDEEGGRHDKCFGLVDTISKKNKKIRQLNNSIDEKNQEIKNLTDSIAGLNAKIDSLAKPKPSVKREK